MEVWKPVKDYEGLYEVSNTGRVRSLDRRVSGIFFHGQILKPLDNRTGYFRVVLSKNNKKHKAYIHRVVGFAFVPGYFDGADINHIDENKSNNHADNLEWVTRKQNNSHGTRTERATSRHMKIVIQYDLQDNVLAQFKSLKDAASTTAISYKAISNAARGKSLTAGGYKWKYYGQ